MDHYGDLYDSVGTMAGSLDDGTEVVGLLFPRENALNEDDTNDMFLTLAAAKALLIDLQWAIDAAIKHKRNNQ